MGWRGHTLLGSLAPAERDQLLELGTKRSYPAGARLIEQGTETRFAVLLVAGFVRVTTWANPGRARAEVLLTIRGEGDLVGDMAAISGRPRSASVTACTPISARLIRPDDFRSFMAKHPVAGELINGLIVEELAGANRRRVEYATRPVLQRLARLILELAASFGRPAEGAGVRLPAWFSQADLADLVGVSEDSVQRALRPLRQGGIVGTGYRTITVLDEARLVEVADASL